ncbi:hypothetical protein AA313_de0208017 [Arthrobotrys entomopaga]|nr:hypothetical protein AA313_de0208017 [Arthrobotrys entomopaga]
MSKRTPINLTAEEFDGPRRPPAEAPWYEIPDRQFLTVEHPAVVKNEEKAVRTLGGRKAVAKNYALDPPTLYLHPSPEDQRKPERYC